MKKIAKIIFVIVLANLTLVACAQTDKNENKKTTKDVEVVKKQETLKMNQDTLNARILADMQQEIVKQKVALTNEALTTISQTQNLLKEINEGNSKAAIKKGKELIGDLEVLLAKDPSLALIPVNVAFQKEEFVADVETVRKSTKLAKKAMNKGYYRVASDLLKDLRSEMVINTYLIPTATYPEAIKASVIALEENNPDLAKIILFEVLNTVVIEKVVLPLPILKAEQMIIEAAAVDAKDHDNVNAVINLLNNAEYQLQLAEELGYGKKDKDYAMLSKAIHELKKSVEEKKDSSSKFDDLKLNMKKFQERLFPRKNDKK